MNVPPEAITAAAIAIERELMSGTDYTMAADSDEALARAALAGAAPHIAAAERERVAILRAAIQEVLDDDETGAGGWGPDITMVAVLKQAMEATSSRQDRP